MHEPELVMFWEAVSLTFSGQYDVAADGFQQTRDCSTEWQKLNWIAKSESSSLSSRIAMEE